VITIKGVIEVVIEVTDHATGNCNGQSKNVNKDKQLVLHQAAIRDEYKVFNHERGLCALRLIKQGKGCAAMANIYAIY
jgi:hypothetical protein